jgi:hypothetical protein
MSGSPFDGLPWFVTLPLKLALHTVSGVEKVKEAFRPVRLTDEQLRERLKEPKRG